MTRTASRRAAPSAGQALPPSIIAGHSAEDHWPGQGEGGSHNELIKHSSAVHISNSISLTERKISNILLKNAFHEMNTRETHSIAISEICRLIGWNESKAYDELKKAVTALNATQIQWNILGKDRKNVWGVTTILAQAKIERGICTYAYSPMMKELLASPNIYARLNLLVQRNFRSKHALAIWEFLIESLCTAKTDRITTDWIEVGAFRRLLGIDGDGCYQDFRYLKSKVISPAIEEINKESDVWVEVDYKKEGRRVVGLRFQVHRKNTYQYAMDLAEEEAAKLAAQQEGGWTEEQPRATTPKAARKKAPSASAKASPVAASTEFSPVQSALMQRLTGDYGLSERQAAELVEGHAEATVSAAIAYTERQEKAGRVKNRKAYLVKAIQQGWKGEEEEKMVASPAPSTAASAPALTEETGIDPVWAKVRARLKEAVGDATFTHWLAGLTLSDRKGRRVMLKAPGKFVRSHVENTLMDDVLKAWKAEDKKIGEVVISC
jgi:plasmid replication initiation protein